MVKHCIWLVITTLYSLNSAQAFSLPTFDLEKSNTEQLPLNSLNDQAGIQNFRVLVFPHRGTYTIPQGRDSKVSSVKIVAAHGCKKFAAKMNPETSEWEKQGALLQTAKEFYISTTNAGPYFYECENGFKIVRTSNLKSYTYAGHFISRAKSTSVQIINIISPEEYLKGVVPAEVVATWPIEILRAQAVAARTYAWWSVIQSRSRDPFKPFDVDDTVQYQAYVGTGAETENSNQAIADTSSVVLRHQGKIIKAYFSADSGGHTEKALTPFNEDLPYCQAKPELYHPEAIQTDWTATLSLSKIGSYLSAKGLIPYGVKITNIEVKQHNRNESGRAGAVTLTSSTGKIYTVTGAKFRLALSLRSTMFNVTMQKSKTSSGQMVSSAKFQGKGHGHGVGMSQKGALAYVEHLGWSHEQVLKFYYSDVTLSH